MALVTVHGLYEVSADTLWRHVVRYDALQATMNGPFVRVRCPPGEERIGDEVALVFRLFDAIPVGAWRFKVIARDDARRRLLSDEHGSGVRRWVHEVVIDAVAESRSQLTDTIEIDAGGMTPLVAWFARRDYARRHRVRKRIVEMR